MNWAMLAALGAFANLGFSVARTWMQWRDRSRPRKVVVKSVEQMTVVGAVERRG